MDEAPSAASKRDDPGPVVPPPPGASISTAAPGISTVRLVTMTSLPRDVCKADEGGESLSSPISSSPSTVRRRARLRFARIAPYCCAAPFNPKDCVPETKELLATRTSERPPVRQQNRRFLAERMNIIGFGKTCRSIPNRRFISSSPPDIHVPIVVKKNDVEDYYVDVEQLSSTISCSRCQLSTSSKNRPMFPGSRRLMTISHSRSVSEMGCIAAHP